MTDARDLIPLNERLSCSRHQLHEPVELLSEGSTLAQRLMTGGEFARCEVPGAWLVRWPDQISGHYWPLDDQRVADRVVSAHMRSTAAAPLRTQEVQEITARLCALLDARETTPTRTTPSLSVEAAIARRLTRTWRLHVDRAGRLLGHPVADEASGVAPDPAGRGIAVEARPRPGRRTGDVEITPQWLADHARSVGLLQRYEQVEDWAAVVAELRGPVPAPSASDGPRPGSWLRRTPTP